MWQDQYYINKNLAFGAAHGTAIFKRITNFILFILANQGIRIFNYIYDMGIVVDVNARTFSIPADKLNDIWCL